MTTNMLDFLVFIGRFQPCHKGHIAVIKRALREGKQLIILCGSSHVPRSTRNPWLFHEREAMIRSALSDEENARTSIRPLLDILYNDDAWVKSVQSIVKSVISQQLTQNVDKASVGLIGHAKDQTSYYLNLFPQWRSVSVENINGISATPLRERYFSVNKLEDEFFLDATVQAVFPESILHALRAFSQTSDFSQVRSEQQFISRYKSAWDKSPYPPTFVTVDAVVGQSGHVLLIRRRAMPGKGLLALPGGFVNQDESLLDACLRELREETRLKVPVPVLKGSISSQRVFDEPNRSTRGRTITHVFHIELEPNSSLPKVKGGDDAAQAMWVPLSELRSDNMYEDHYFILQQFLGL